MAQVSTGRAGYIGKRLLQSLGTLLVLVCLVFVIFRLLPGDPSLTLVDPLADAATKALVRQQFGLDQPLPVQFGLYLRNLLHGSLGVSFEIRQPVLAVVGPAFINTLALVVLCTLVSYGLGTLFGAWLAWRRGTRVETVGTVAALVLRAAPPFWVGLMAIMLFSFRLDWLPFFGMHAQGAQPVGILQTFFTRDFLRHAALPVLVGSAYFMGLPLLIMRGTMADVLDEDFVELAHAKGLRAHQVLLRHAARNALLPVLTEAGSFMGWAMGGLVIIEYIFSWPGLGSQIVHAVGVRDYPVAQGALILIACLITLLNLAVDLLYVYVDPRVDLR